MRNALRNGWKRVCSMILAAAMVFTMLPVNMQAATTSSSNGDGTFNNPVIYADVPDIDIIRVENAYYMVSTTMHLSPGCPIMKSTDLVNWEIVNYVYDILGDTDAMNLRNGESMYGNGQWAASLKYHNGTYYVAFNSNTTGTAYLYTTDDIEKGAWTKTTLNGSFHDMSLFFDDNGKAYILYGGGQIKCAELSEDLKTVKKETEQQLFDVKTEEWGEDKIGTGLAGEGTHIMKKDGYYYVFNVCWPDGGVRTEICHRSRTFPSTEWENKVILKADFQNHGAGGGVAQGAVIDTADGKWYGFMFQDHGAIGRVPVLTDCTWIEDWPMLGKDGDGQTVEETMPLPVAGSDSKSLAKSDEFYNDAEHRVFEAGQADAAVAKTYNSAAAFSSEEADTIELVENGNFEKGTEGWAGFENGEIETVVTATDGTENNNHVLHVKNRKNSSSSAMYDLTGKLKKGTAYTVKGKMKYAGGPQTKKFTVRLQHNPNGAERPFEYRTGIGEIELQENKWKAFEFSYTAADLVSNGKTFEFSTDNNYFFIEESKYVADSSADVNSGMDYYLDDISITCEKQEVIELIPDGSFKQGQGKWTANSPAVVTAVSNEGHEDTNCLKIAGCNDGGWSGISYNPDGNQLSVLPGKNYTFTAWVKYEGTGEETAEIVTTIKGALDGKDSYEDMARVTAKAGQWVKMTGSRKMLNYDDGKAFIYIHMPGATAEKPLSFYLDDVSMSTPSDNLIKNGSFENGLKNWEAKGGKGTLSIAADKVHDGASSVKVTDRKDTASGPAQSLGSKMKIGNQYTVSAWVLYEEGPDEKQFYLTLENGEYNAKNMAGKMVPKGQWTEIKGTWTMPDDARTGVDNILFVETEWVEKPSQENDLMDFYVDNVTMTEKVKDKEPPEAGEHDYNGSNLDLVWQWNHNPNNNNWSLTERNGWLRLKTGSKASSLLNARNTLTQRTFGPVCSGAVKMDISNMKSGDVAGLGSLSFKYGYIAVKKEGENAKLVMMDASGNYQNEKDKTLVDAPVEKASVDCTSNIVYLKEDFNFAGNEGGTGKDTVSFYYSFDGKTWNQLGEAMQLRYELIHFMGSKFAIFNYATKVKGGYVDFDYFRVSDKITGAEQPSGTWNATMTASPEEISGVAGSECEVKLNLDKLESGNHTGLKASISIPDIMTVEDVVFSEAIKGEANYTFANGRLNITVKGNDVSFAAEDKLFATIKLKLKGYVDKDETVTVSADYIRTESGAVEYQVDNCSASINLKYLDTQALAKKLGYGNPITTHEFGADPYAIIYDGRVYVYMTADDYEFSDKENPYSNNFGYITTLRVVSSADLVNWTDHGEIDVAGSNGGKGPAKWASHAWAPAVAYKQIDGKDKFFLYFANDASGIGVLEGDSPIGPWKDPIGEALITGQTPGCQGVVWCFDPAVLVDDDGSAYIYFGGGVPDGQQDNPKTARVAKLGEDMISIEGEAKEIDAPCMFEDGGIFKYNGKYYYSYCSNFVEPHKEGYPGYGSICYMVSDNPMGPFEYKGEIFSNPSVWFGVGGNNHHATFVYEGKSYFIYHAQTVSKALGIEKGYRSTHIDKIDMNSDGTIKSIKGTYTGIPQLRGINPYERIDAETIAWNSGVKAAACKEPGKLFDDYNMVLTDLQDGDWTSVSQLEFGDKGTAQFEVYAASKKGGKIEIRLESPQGKLVGTVDVPATRGNDTYQKVSCEVENITGTQNVFLVFHGNEPSAALTVYREKLDALKGAVTAAEQTLTAKQQLQRQIDKAGKLKSGMSQAEAEAFQNDIREAEAVRDKTDATDQEVKDAITKLNTLMDQKDSAAPIEDKTAILKEKLDYKIAEAKTLLEQLPDTEKAALQTAIDEVNEFLNSDNIMNVDYYQFTPVPPTEQQITDMNQQITAAKELLEKLSGADKEKLQAAITEAEAVLKKENLAKEELQAALDKLTAAVKAAEEIIEAGKPVDEQLSNKIAEAKKLLEGLSAEKKEALQAAITKAEEALKKPGVTEAELKTALDQLKAAIEEAQKPGGTEKPEPPTEQQKAEMANKLTAAKKLLEQLNETEKAKLQAAITEAETVLKKENLTKEELQAALDKLTAAVKAAEEIIEAGKPVDEQLSNKIAEAKKLLENLTPEKKEKLQAVINEAEALLKKPGVTEAEIQAVLDKLKTAMEEAARPGGSEQPQPPAGEKPALNQTFTASSGLTYKVTAYSAKAKNVTVIGTKKQLTSATVPDTLVYKTENFKVTAIGDSAFANQKNLKSAVIGKYVASIGNRAFQNDKKLVKITFKGTAVKKIGKDAFKNIGKKAVFNMKKTFTAKNLKYKITKCTASLKQVTITGASKKLTSIKIPATVKFNGMTFKVTAVNKKAFKNQKKLKSVVISKYVKSIGSEAFSGAKKLAKIKFSGTAIKSIGKNAFKSIKKKAVFSVKKSKRAYYKKLLKKAKTKNYKVK